MGSEEERLLRIAPAFRDLRDLLVEVLGEMRSPGKPVCTCRPALGYGCLTCRIAAAVGQEPVWGGCKRKRGKK